MKSNIYTYILFTGKTIRFSLGNTVNRFLLGNTEKRFGRKIHEQKQNILKQISSIGVKFAFVTLHIGIGTFRPVYSKNPSKHKMHPERWQIDQSAVNKINTAKQNGQRVIAVGTTTTRLLENSIEKSGQSLEPGNGFARNFILPGYKFKIVDGIITNFHLPKSTLLMMVSAMAGKENILSAYNNAIENNYRFYSFGDSMLII